MTRSLGVGLIGAGWIGAFHSESLARRIPETRLGMPQLLRSVTRDPAGFDPARVPPWTIYLETLIHDFDTLRYLNPGAEAVDVYAVADALVHPDWKERGLLDTAIVTIRFDNGA